MKSKAERTKVFLLTLKFQKFIAPTLLAVVVLLLAAVLSLQAGTSVVSVEAASDLVCPAEIISYWTLDETTGPPYADSLLTNDANCIGSACPTSVLGRVNSALSFDGNDALNVDNHSSLNWASSASFSIELWVKTSQACPSPNDRIFIGKHSNNARWWLGCRRDGQDRATFVLRDSNNTERVLSGTAITDGNWHHLVAIRDAADGTNRLYVDGAAFSQPQAYSGNFTNTGQLNIGHYAGGNSATAVIDEVALYNRALTADEILGHYNGGAGQPYCTLAPQIDPIDDQTVTVGIPFTYVVEADGIPAPNFTFTASPDGMTIDENTGEINWTPTAAGTVNVTVEASNVAGSDTEEFTITVNAPPLIDPIPNQGAIVGQAFTYPVQASGHPAPTFALADGSPPGMTIDPDTGLIEWTPAANGIFPVTVVASNIIDDDEANFTIEVTAAPVITTIADQTAVVGLPFTYLVEASGDPAPSFSLTTSPVGMTINVTTGEINWTPTAAGIFNVTVRAQNTAGSATANFTIAVAEPGVEGGHFLFLPLVIRNP